MKKKNNKWIGLIIGLVCVAILLALMLTMCSDGVDNKDSKPVETDDSTIDSSATEATVATTDATSAPTEESTEPPTETVTEPSTEATEPTTEVTEPSEEATKPTGGNTRPGGGSIGGGNTNIPTEPTEPTEPEIEVNAPGTQTNAYTESVSTLPDSFTTVKIPVSDSMYYNLYTAGAFLIIEDSDASVVYNGMTYESVEGVLTVELTVGTGDDPSAFQIINQGEVEKAFEIKVLDAVGTVSNPIVLDSIEQFKTNLNADDSDGVYYTWIADSNCTLEMALSAIVPQTAAADIIVTIGENTVKLSESTNGVLEIDIAEGDTLLIQVVTIPDVDGTYPAAEVTLSSSEKLPVDLYVLEIPGAVETEVILAGTNAYYNLYGANNTILTVSDADVYVVYNGETYRPDESGTISLKLKSENPRYPVALQIGNDATEDKPVTLNFEYPLGSYGNPEPLTELEDIDVSLEAYTEGYYYTYTATESGILTFQIWTAPEEDNVKTDIVVTNNTTSVQNSLWYYDEEQALDVQNPTVSVFVSEGDTVSVVVSAIDMDSFAGVDAQLTIYGDLYGTAENPIIVLDDGSDEVEATITMTMLKAPAGNTLYYAISRISDGVLTVTGEGSFTVSYNGSDYSSVDGVATVSGVSATSMTEPAIISITGDTACAYALMISFLPGHQMNPDALIVDIPNSNTASLAEDDEDGYFFMWMATGNGELRIIMPASAGSNWQAYLYNKTSFTQTDVLKSDDETDTLTIEVSQGDLVEVCVNTYDPANSNNYPAGKIAFSAYMHGSESDPIVVLDDGTDEDESVVTMTTSQLLLNERFYFAIPRVSGATVTVYGNTRFEVTYNGTTVSSKKGKTVTFNDVSAVSMNQPAIICIQGKVSIQSYKIVVSFPEGHQMNPAELDLENGNTAILQENDADGYLLRWVAADDGVLTLTMPEEGGWQVFAQNNTTFAQTESINSAGETDVLPVEVHKDDVILIYVNTYDPEDPYSYPAGEIVVSASFVAASVDETSTTT